MRRTIVLLVAGLALTCKAARAAANVIACKSCKRSFDKEAHNGYCPFCGANNN